MASNIVSPTSAKATARIDFFPPVTSAVDDDDDADNTESTATEESGCCGDTITDDDKRKSDNARATVAASAIFTPFCKGHKSNVDYTNCQRWIDLGNVCTNDINENKRYIYKCHLIYYLHKYNMCFSTFFSTLPWLIITLAPNEV
jgi:hypothetical protein